MALLQGVAQRAVVAALLVAFVSCDSAIEFEPPQLALEFDPAVVDLDTVRDTVVVLRNVGVLAAAEVSLIWADSAGVQALGVSLSVTPAELGTVGPGAASALAVSITTPPGLPPGSYIVRLEARPERAAAEASLDVRFRVSEAERRVAFVDITSGAATPRQGDVVRYAAEVRDSGGAVLVEPVVMWSLVPASAGLLTGDGRFVGYAPGNALVIARAGGAADTLDITVAPRGLSGGFAVVGRGSIGARFTSDLWVHGSVAYTGSWSMRAAPGNALYVWDVSDPTQPALVDSVVVDATTVNDVKIRSDGAMAVLTHEGSRDSGNGITLLDLQDPLHPAVITRFTSGLEPGVHNVWVEGDYVYAAVDGGGNGLLVVDISAPQNPRAVASFFAGSSFLHDVYVRDGLAFLSHWDAGLVILDVGNGIAGGSPASPVEVSRILTMGGQTHNAWYWPEAGYVFVGEEDFSTPGVMHVIDVSDLRRPVEVATFQVSGETPHNFWLDEAAGVLYAAWYTRGVRAIDVSGELLGALDRQGREIAFSQYAGVGSCAAPSGTATCTWAPQLHGGLIYLSDMNSGLWVLRRD
ncbi:MAG: hypothetical protein GTN62_07555 [Gemmatimonadales bacterium]|nr:hypothetical protein [Gemmatimonadales bacterium]NIN11346.1 hypothetical protein [Gemmatimonadales bacterium]NIN49956.1 hypothetical protein [Gemmatimonadales bacterium]NIP07420.1 hypothetical protein [Gemmatimonadales bacterium]NIR00487.1 hypothetical protein [Gemmatimonadales bacterium]